MSSYFRSDFVLFYFSMMYIDFVIISYLFSSIFYSREVGSGCWVLLSQRYADFSKFRTKLLLPVYMCKLKIDILFLNLSNYTCQVAERLLNCDNILCFEY